jgi:hypothetical protein
VSIAREISRGLTTGTTLSTGRATTLVSFRGTGTVTINQDINVTSITDAGTGRYVLNFETNYKSAAYVASIMARDADAAENGAANLAAITSNSTKTVSQFRVISCYAPTNTLSDTSEYNVQIFGELADE